MFRLSFLMFCSIFLISRDVIFVTNFWSVWMVVGCCMKCSGKQFRYCWAFLVHDSTNWRAMKELSFHGDLF